jgi:hypothetical protein
MLFLHGGDGKAKRILSLAERGWRLLELVEELNCIELGAALKIGV